MHTSVRQSAASMAHAHAVALATSPFRASLCDTHCFYLLRSGAEMHGVVLPRDSHVGWKLRRRWYSAMV
jgi:hypothetical protein